MKALVNCLVLENELFPVLSASSTGSYRWNVLPFINTDASMLLQKEVESLSLDARLMINKIQSFGSLDNDWDGYGAVRPGVLAINAAISAVNTFDLLNQKVYFTAPGPSGDILLELKKGDKSIEFYYNGEVIEYASFHGDECESESTLRADGYSQLIKWLNS